MLSHSFLCSLHFLSMFFNDPCQRSRQPSVCGWYGDVLSCLTSKSRHSCLVRRPMKTEPWSVNISSGNPALEKISIMASATVSASTLRNATASGYLDARHIYVSVGKLKFVVFPARICVAVVSLLHSKEIELKLHD